MAYSWGRTRDYGDEAHEGMYPGHREEAREYGGGGLLGLLSGRNKDFVGHNKDRMRAMGIEPSHVDREGNLTGRYSSGDWKSLQDALAGNVEVDISALLNQDTSGIGPLSDYGYDEQDAGQPRELGNIRQWGTQNPNMPGSMALDPTWAGGVRGAGLGAEMTPGDRLGGDRDLSKLSRDSRFAPGTVPGNITGTRGYLPGRMSVGEAKRARAMRNMSERDRQEAGFSGYNRTGNYSEWDRISAAFDKRMGRMKDKLRDWDIEDRTRRPNIMGGGPSTRIQPDWSDLSDALSRMGMEEDRGADR